MKDPFRYCPENGHLLVGDIVKVFVRTAMGGRVRQTYCTACGKNLFMIINKGSPARLPEFEHMFRLKCIRCHGRNSPKSDPRRQVPCLIVSRENLRKVCHDDPFNEP